MKQRERKLHSGRGTITCKGKEAREKVVLCRKGGCLGVAGASGEWDRGEAGQ